MDFKQPTELELLERVKWLAQSIFEDKEPVARAIELIEQDLKPQANAPSKYAVDKIIFEVYGLDLPEKKTLSAVLPYPIEVWDDTLYGEFALRCAFYSFISRELFVEAMKTCVGAVVGNRLIGSIKGMRAQQYTVAVAKPQSGKDTAFDEAIDMLRGAEEFDRDGAGLLGNSFKTSNIGATVVNFASENAAIVAGNDCPRLLHTPAEFGSFIDKSGIAGAGSALLEFVLTAFDSFWPKFSTAKDRTKVPARLWLSMLTSIQPDRLTGMNVTSGLYSRITWLMPPPLNVVAALEKPVFGDFQKRLFEKLMGLEEQPLEIKVLPEALREFNDWFEQKKQDSYEDEQIFARINIFVLRNALHLAWMFDEVTVTQDTMRKACQLGDWQLSVRAELFLSETVNDLACQQQKIKRALAKHGHLSGRDLKKLTNGSRIGTDIYKKALIGLVEFGEVREVIGARRNQNIYFLPKETEQ
jgi:hypothetical protein